MKHEVILEFTYNVTPERLWKALTNREEMKKWYFEVDDFRAEPGFEFRFWGSTETRKYLHICRITEVVMFRKLCHTWQYDGITGFTELCFKISPLGDNLSKLKLSHTGFETFPTDNPDLDPKNFDAGWKYILGKSLKNYLEKII